MPGRICPHGDDTCPCQDGDACHYETTEESLAWPCPTSGIVACGAQSRDEAIHHWFGLSYANYLVVPRVLLQSMPADWQHQFVALLTEMFDAAEAAGFEEPPGGYRVHALDDHFRFATDPWSQYDRGRRRVM